MTSATHISQYTPTDEVPELGDAELHPTFGEQAFRGQVLRDQLADLVRPDTALWNARELRDLTSYVSSELTGPLLDITEVREQQRWWARLALTAGVELWLLTWAPGQGTEPHDHGGASGSFTVLFGQLRENYRYPPGPIRTADHDVGSAIGFDTERAHEVLNVSSVNSASVHAYSPPLLPVRDYAHLDDIPPAIANSEDRR